MAKFDVMERGVVAGLMEQTRELIAPDEREEEGTALGVTGDAFDQLVAGLGVSLSAQDQVPEDTADATDTSDLSRELADMADRDPALDRLLPTAHKGDDQVAAEFRRLTEHDLRDRKATMLATSIDALRAPTGDRLELTRAQAEAMVVALTDTRLLLGERLGLRTDEDALRLDERVAALDDDDPTTYAASFYDFLTWMQESLTTALMGRGLFF